MGLLSTYLKLKEYVKIYKFKLKEEISRHRIFWELVRNRWRSLFALFGLITICFVLDILFVTSIIPFISNQPWFVSLSEYIQFPNTQTIIGLLSAIVQGVAALIGLLLSISLVVLELAANRYPYRMVRFLIEEKVGAYILDMLVTTLLFSLWTLFLLQRGAKIPYVSVLVCVLLTSFSIVFLFVYRKHSLYFFQPRRGFLITSKDVKGKIRIVFEKGSALGRSVSTYLQETVQERIFLMKDFLMELLEKEDPEATYGLLELSSILSLYVEGVRFIDTESGWFPLREVPMQEMEYALQLTQITEELALGTRTKREPHIHWFDGEILDIIGAAQRKIIEKDDEHCSYALLLSYKELIEKCFEQQEFSILDHIVNQVHDFAIMAAKAHPNEFYNLVMLLVEKSIQGSDLQSVRDAITKISWQSNEEIMLLRLPKIFHEELLSYKEKLQTELIIEGKILTPLDWTEKDILDKISKVDADFCRKYYRNALNILCNIHEKVSSEKHLSGIRNVLVAQLLALRRALVMGKNIFVSENIDGVLKQVWKSYKVLGADKKLRLSVFKEIKLGCLNSIKTHQEESLRKFFGILCIILNQESGEKKDIFLEDALEALLIVMSFAFLDSEFYTSSKSFEIVEELALKFPNVDKLVEIFQIMTKQYASRWTLKYHNWFKDIFLERHKLPTVAKTRKGFRSLDIVYDHPSQFIQRTYHIGIRDCAEAMIQKLLQRLKQSVRPKQSKVKKQKRARVKRRESMSETN